MGIFPATPPKKTHVFRRVDKQRNSAAAFCTSMTLDRMLKPLLQLFAKRRCTYTTNTNWREGGIRLAAFLKPWFPTLDDLRNDQPCRGWIG